MESKVIGQEELPKNIGWFTRFQGKKDSTKSVLFSNVVFIMIEKHKIEGQKYNRISALLFSLTT